jgi:hypothetical protein
MMAAMLCSKFQEDGPFEGFSQKLRQLADL